MIRVAMVSILMIFSSCMAIMGIRKPQNLTQGQIKTVAERQSINGSLFALDTAYNGFLSSIKQINPTAYHDHIQPLQLCYFDQKGKLISFHINCNAPGLKKLNWNSNGQFDQFPPITQTAVDTLVNLSALYPFLKPIDSSGSIGSSPARWTVVVFWNDFMRNYSKDMIEQFQKNLALAVNPGSVVVMYVNTDTFYSAI